MSFRYWTLTGAIGIAASLGSPAPAHAQGYLGPNLSTFAVLGGTTVTCTGASTIIGNVGVSPGSAITGFPAPCTAVGALLIPPASDPAQAELLTAYNTLVAQPCSSTVGPDLAGLTLVPGVYCVNAAASNLTGTLTLDAQGNPNAVWVFQMSSSLITSPGSTVSIINGGSPCGVQWQVSSSATIGSGTTFVGNILALTSIAMNTGANLTGRALARNGAVTLDTNNVNAAACVQFPAPPPFPPPPVPTLPEIAAWTLLAVLLGGGAYMLSRRTPTEASK
jgi:hypothetical protein